jgi:hypothetical protein
MATLVCELAGPTYSVLSTLISTAETSLKATIENYMRCMTLVANYVIHWLWIHNVCRKKLDGRRRKTLLLYEKGGSSCHMQMQLCCALLLWIERSSAYPTSGTNVWNSPMWETCKCSLILVIVKNNIRVQEASVELCLVASSSVE